MMMRTVCSALLLMCVWVRSVAAVDVAFWKPYEPSEATAGLWHLDGDGRDASPHGQHAAVVGPVQWADQGRFGRALAIAGRPAALRVPLRVPLPGTLRAKVVLVPPGTYPLAIEAWVRLDEGPRGEAVVVDRPLIPGQTGAFRLGVDAQRGAVFRWQNYEPGAASQEVRTEPAAVPSGRWTHLAVVFQWGNSFVLYVNGAEKARQSFFTWHVRPAPGLVPPPEGGQRGELWVGNDAALAHPFPGLIDELRLATDVFEVFPEPDNAWTDPKAARPLVVGPPYLPPREEVLLYASFDRGPEADWAGGSARATPAKGMEAVPGIRGSALARGARFDAKGNLDLREGALELWFQPQGWDNIHNFHCGVAGGPFMIYVFNTGYVSPGGTALVAWSGDRTWASFDDRFRAGPYYPGRWTHLVVTWKGPTVRTYVDGSFRNEHTLQQGTVADCPHYAPQLVLEGSNLYDEVWVYRRMLSDAEVANAYWRYRDPSKLAAVPAVPCRLAYAQGPGAVVARFHMAASPVRAQVRRVRLGIAGPNGRTRWQGEPVEPAGPTDVLVQAAPRLEDGRYLCTAEALDAAGQVIGKASQPFTVKHYPWEGNRIGCTDRVIPPYTPLEVQDRRVRPWGREYEIGGHGLPAQIQSQGIRLLVAPIRLEGVVGGRRVVAGDGQVALSNPRPHRVDVAGRSRLDAIDVRADGWIEYDGWFQVRLTLRADPPTPLESLELVCDLWTGADTIYAQYGDSRDRGKFGALPPGQGVVWHSRMLPSPGWRWGSFLPIVFLGSGDAGLWWLAESNDGWVQRADVPCVQIERQADRHTLRFHLIAGPTSIAQPRTIEFAFLVTPVKPLPTNRRALAWGWPEPHYVHDTSGYRYYGDSVDAYALHTPEDFHALRQFLLLPSQTNPNYAWWENHAEKLRQGRPLVLYGSTWMTGAGFPEFDTFRLEWQEDYNWCRPMPDPEFLGRTNYGGTVRWLTPRQLSATGVNFCQSQIDCFIWYHQKLVELAGINGTWWDNSSVGEIYEFVPGRGRVWKWNVFARRQLTKRLATMGWDLGRPPLWLQNMHVDFSWCQIGWHIENDFYIRQPGMDQIDQLSVDEFRAMTRLKGGLISQLHSHIPEEGNPWDVQRAVRSIIGLCLLHDIGERGLPTWKSFYSRDRQRALEVMEQAVRFFSGSPDFIPYWRSRSAVAFDTPNVYASVYVYRKGPAWEDRTPLPPRAVVVLLNANDRDTLVEGFQVHPKALGWSAVRRITDGETGLPLARLYDRTARRHAWGDLNPGQVMLRRHDYRLLVVE